jgi:restriction system protein
MARKNTSPAELLILAPWWVSATLSGLVFASMRWVLPAFGSDNIVLKTFIPALVKFAWLPALFFAALAGVSALFAKKRRALLDSQKDAASLQSLSWKEFEWLVGEAYRRQGYEVEESLGKGADGGIDLVLHKGAEAKLVQCKQWKVQSVGAPVVREIFGLVAHHQASGAIVITTGRFTREAEAFAEGKPIELIDGPALLALVKAVQINQRPAERLTAPTDPTPATLAPSASTPTCPNCGKTMVKRVARKGSNAGNSFWGCPSYPQCRGVRNM